MHYASVVQPADFLIEHADLIATCAGPAPRRGLAQREMSPLHNGSIAAHEGRITYVGAAADLPEENGRPMALLVGVGWR